MKTIRPWESIFSPFSVSFLLFQMPTLTSGEEEMMSMDPEVGKMMRNVIGFWLITHVLNTSLLFTDTDITTYVWQIKGILAVTSSLEVGVCICYLWTRHNCSGFIFKEEWMNWFAWSVILIFFFLGIIAFTSDYVIIFFFLILFSMDFSSIENIIFILPIARMVFSFYISEM